MIESIAPRLVLPRRNTIRLLASATAIGGSASFLNAAQAQTPVTNRIVQWCISSVGVVMVGTGQSVAQWQDQSGSGNDLVQPSVTSRPRLIANAINGLPAVSFDGAQQYLANPYLGEPRCEIVVARLRSAPVESSFYTLLGANGPPYVDIGAYYLQVLAAPDSFNKHYRYLRPTMTETVALPEFAVSAASQPVVGPWAIYAVRNDGRTVRLYKSGLLCGDPVPVGAMPSQPIHQATFGCGFYKGLLADFAPVDVAEKLSYLNDLSDDQFKAVISYLETKYGLLVSALSGPITWPVFQGNGVDERGTNKNLVLLQGDGEKFVYRPSHYLPPPGTCVRDLSAIEWLGSVWLIHTRGERGQTPSAFQVAVSHDGMATFKPVAAINVAAAFPGVPKVICWAPEFVRNRDNSVYLQNGFPVALCNVAPVPFQTNNSLPGMQYFLFTPTESTLTQPWKLLGRLEGLPPNIIDGFLFYDPGRATFYVSTTPNSPPQPTVLYQSNSILGPYSEFGVGANPYRFSLATGGHEGTSILSLGQGIERYFLDARGKGYFISDNPGGIAPQGWSTPRLVATPIIPQHGTPFPTPSTIATI